MKLFKARCAAQLVPTNRRNLGVHSGQTHRIRDCSTMTVATR